MRIGTVGNARTRAALVVAVVSLVWPSLANGQSRADDASIRLSTETVVVPATVRGPDGRLVTDLTAADFEVKEDGTRVPVDAFAVVRRPLRIVLLVDTSLSMDTTLEAVRVEASRFVDALRDDDRVSVSWFASDAFTEVQWLDKAEAKRRISAVVPAPHMTPVPATVPGVPGYDVGDVNTNLYDAMISLVGSLDSREPTAVVLFSDGIDTSGGRRSANRKRADERGEFALDMVRRSWAVVYPVRYKTEQFLSANTDPKVFAPGVGIQIGRGSKEPSVKFVETVAAISGGTVFEYATQSDLAAALATALDELRNRYLLAYSAPDGAKRDGYHRIEVRVRRSGCRVRTREGYAVSGAPFAPSAPR